jgi:hypothetical protein
VCIGALMASSVGEGEEQRRGEGAGMAVRPAMGGGRGGVRR